MQLLKFTLLLFFITAIAIGQEQSLIVKNDSTSVEIKEINKNHLESYKKNPDFDYTQDEDKSNFITNFFSWLSNILTRFFEGIFGVGNVGGILYFIFNILPYLILAFLIYLLIKFFLKVNSNNIIASVKNSPTVVFTEEEQIIKNENIQTLINEAIKQKNYRLAIRYYYLLSLKYLNEQEIITWQQEKTNNDYITEIQKENLQSDFKSITRIYDYVWYGEFNIDQLKFETLKVSFENLNNTIKHN